MRRSRQFGEFDRARHVHRLPGELRRRRKLAQDIPAPIDRFLQQMKIFGESVVARRNGGHLMDDESNGSERRAQFMRRGCSEPIELREMLGARHNEFDRGQGAGRLPRFGRHPIGVERHERRADHKRRPDADQIKRREDERSSAGPGERQVEAKQRGRAKKREEEQCKRSSKGERGRSDGDWRQQEHDKGIGHSAGQEQQARQLENVVAQNGGRDGLAELRAGRVNAPQRQIERCRGGDDCETGDREVAKSEAEKADENRGGLSGDCEPAQTDEGAESQTARLKAPNFRLRRRNGCQIANAPPMPAGVIRSSRWDRRPKACIARYSL